MSICFEQIRNSSMPTLSGGGLHIRVSVECLVLHPIFSTP